MPLSPSGRLARLEAACARLHELAGQGPPEGQRAIAETLERLAERWVAWVAATGDWRGE